jgi:hypothetical protein
MRHFASCELKKLKGETGPLPGSLTAGVKGRLKLMTNRNTNLCPKATLSVSFSAFRAHVGGEEEAIVGNLI